MYYPSFNGFPFFSNFFAHYLTTYLYGMLRDDIICALSTPQGVGALAIIRVSGANSKRLLSPYFHSKRVNKSGFTSHVAYFGDYSIAGEHIDEVLITYFEDGKSFTGEESFEISSHGSPYIIGRIIESLLHAGARLADPGEYTMRAFMNGKMDLAQAEAVADLIHAENKTMHDVALRQLKGGLSNEITLFREDLVHFASMIELELDFSEEDVEFASRDQLLKMLHGLLQKVSALIDSFKYGNAIKKGIATAILGAPNAGKSTLLNALLGEDRAIVSAIAGTTRDTVEDTFNFGGLTYRLIDTAGIIQKAFEQAEKADVIFYLIDATAAEDDLELRLAHIKTSAPQAHLFVCINKLDQASAAPIKERLKQIDCEIFAIAAKNKTGLTELLTALKTATAWSANSSSQTIVTNARHADALRRTAEALQKSIKAVELSIPGDLLAQDLRLALDGLGEITGTISTDDLLANIFSKFCIGK
jgi:tRNA modification GTPase